MSETVLVKIDGDIARLVLNRPGSLNALDVEMAEALAQRLHELARATSVRCIVLSGAGGHFMAGGDIGCFHAWLDEPAERRQALIRKVMDPVHQSIRTLRAAPKPVLASVGGACAGFGLSLMAACDLAIASDGTTFSLAYCRIGASPDGGSTFTLPRIIGMKKAMELALLGDRFTSADALAMGLVNRVVPADELSAQTARLARALASGPTAALARAKRLVNSSFEHALDEQLRLEEESFLEGVAGPEFEEGVRAFMAKRPPRFPVP